MFHLSTILKVKPCLQPSNLFLNFYSFFEFIPTDLSFIFGNSFAIGLLTRPNPNPKSNPNIMSNPKPNLTEPSSEL